MAHWWGKSGQIYPLCACPLLRDWKIRVRKQELRTKPNPGSLLASYSKSSTSTGSGALLSSMKGMEEKSLTGLIHVSVYINPTCCYFREDPDPCRVAENNQDTLDQSASKQVSRTCLGISQRLHFTLLAFKVNNYSHLVFFSNLLCESFNSALLVLCCSTN